jgi:hypothetical protein
MIFNYLENRRNFLNGAMKLVHIEYVMLIKFEHLENGIPILKYINEWEKISCANFLHKFDISTERTLNFVLVLFSDIEIHKVRRTIKYDPKWFEESVYEKYQDMEEMELLLKKLNEPRLNDHIKKEFCKNGINIRTKMCGWSIIKRFLLWHPVNWLSYFLFQNWYFQLADGVRRKKIIYDT